MYRRRTGGRRQWDGRDWASWHNQQRAHVTCTFYGLDADVRSIFFDLGERQLTKVFDLYGQAHGPSARQYAVKTYPKWKSGITNPSAETLQRLLQHVPQVLPLHQRAQLLAILRQRSRSVPRSCIRCAPNEVERRVADELAAMLRKSLAHETPPGVKAALSWLSCDSMKAAETILRVSEVIEAEELTRSADIETSRLKHALNRSLSLEGQISGRFSHRVETPYAILEVVVKTPSIFDNLFNSSQTRAPISDITPRKPSDLLGELTGQLSESDKAELRRVAAREQISLDSAARSASLQHSASGAEIDRTLDAAERLQFIDKSAGFNIAGTYKGASGTTSIEVKRGESAATMIKWVVIGGAIVGAIYLFAK